MLLDDRRRGHRSDGVCGRVAIRRGDGIGRDRPGDTVLVPVFRGEGLPVLDLNYQRALIGAAAGGRNPIGHRVRLARCAAREPDGGPRCGV